MSGADRIWGEQASVRAARSLRSVRVAGFRGRLGSGRYRLRPYVPLTPSRVPVPLLPGRGQLPGLRWVSVPRPSVVTLPLFLASMLVVVWMFSGQIAAAAASGGGGRVAGLEDGGALAPLFWPWYLAAASMVLVLSLSARWRSTGVVPAGDLVAGDVVRLPGHRFTAATVASTDRIGDLLDLRFASGESFTVVDSRQFRLLAIG